MSLRFLLITFVLFVSMPSHAQTTIAAVNGNCTVGGVSVMTQGLKSTNLVQGSYPKCLVSVYLTGTTTLATIYSDGSETPLSNPFTANTNASWLFYAVSGAGLDITMSGGTPVSFPQAVTLTDVVPGGSGGSGPGSGDVIASPQHQQAIYPTPGVIGTVQGTPHLTVDDGGTQRAAADNPVVDPSTTYQLETIAGVGYTHIAPPSQTSIQGSSQGYGFQKHYFTSDGWSNPRAGCPLYCPLPGYATISQWLSVSSGDTISNYFGAGIHTQNAINTNCYGIGDCVAGLGYIRSTYAGGYQANSDEGFGAFMASHSWTQADSTFTLSTITDANHIFATPTGNAGTQGQGRFLIDLSAPIMTQGAASIVYSPGQNGHPYGTVVFNNNTLPVSNAQGTMVGNCAVPVQTGGVASATCIVAVTSGTFNTTAPVCMAESSGGEFNYGVQVTAASALSGGQQTLTMNIRRGVGLTTTYVFQGGGCGTMLDLVSDEKFYGAGGGLVRGSVMMIIGSLDTHTLVYVNYEAGQNWGSIPSPGSAFLTQDINGNSIAAGGFLLTNITRVGGIVTANIPGGGNGPDLLNGQRFYTISGCSDASVNGVQSLAASMSGTGRTFTFPQTGADTSCPTAKVVTNNSLATLYPGAEVFSVTNPAASSAATAVDGTFAISYQPAFVIGHSLDMPPHYAASAVGITNRLEMGQPSWNMSGELIQLNQASAYNSVGVDIRAAQTPQDLGGFGGVKPAPTAISTTGNFIYGMHMGAAPIHGGAIIRTELPAINVPYMQNYDALQLSAAKDVLNYDYPSDTFTFKSSNLPTFSAGKSFVESWVPHILANAQFPGLTNTAQISAPITQIRNCTMRGATVFPCYDNVTSGNLGLTVQGTPGTTQYAYELDIHYPHGETFAPIVLITTGPATLDGTNYIQIACTGIPAGLTGAVYVINNPNYQKVGDCASSATILNDQGTYGPIVGGDAGSYAADLIAGAHISAGLGIFGFTQTSPFGVPLTLTAQMSQSTPGVFSFDTTTKGNALATVKAATGTFSAGLTVNGIGVCLTNGTGCPASPTKGRATLVAGTVTVSTVAASTTAIYSLTNCGVGGTQGMLSVGTVVAGTSFVINSSATTADTSTVCWLIQ